MSEDSSVGIVTSYELYVRGFNPGKGTKPPIQWVSTEFKNGGAVPPLADTSLLRGA
jgi:hypothetical protein